MVSRTRARHRARHHLYGLAPGGRDYPAAGRQCDRIRRMAASVLAVRLPGHYLVLLLVALVSRRPCAASRRQPGRIARNPAGWTATHVTAHAGRFHESEPAVDQLDVLLLRLLPVLLPDMAADIPEGSQRHVVHGDEYGAHGHPSCGRMCQHPWRKP